MEEKPKLSVEAEQSDKATILIVVGRVDGSSVGILDSAVQEQIDAGHKTLIFDFKDMSYISSAGLRALLDRCSSDTEGRRQGPVLRPCRAHR